MDIRTPGVATAVRDMTLEDGSAKIEKGAGILVLAEIEGRYLCAGPGGRLFRLGREDLRRRFKALEPAGEDAPSATALSTALLLAGCGALYAAEAGEDATIGSFGDALWYGINTVSTVGVGDVAPATPLGKLVASAMMVVGNPLYMRMGEEMFAGYFRGLGREDAGDRADQLLALARSMV